MKKSIWVTKLTEIRASEYEKYAFAFNGKPESANICSSHWAYLGCDPFNTGAKEDEVVEIIIDTERQSYEIKRQREIGWYLTLYAENACSQATARHWDGNNWRASRKPKRDVSDFSDEEIAVISDKLPYNEYLRSLEQ